MFESKIISVGDAVYDKSAIIYFDQKSPLKHAFYIFTAAGFCTAIKMTCQTAILRH